MTGYNLLWITLLLLAVHHSRRADSFQCYECENCPTIDEGDFKYLKECVLPDNFIVRPTTTAAPVIVEESNETEDISHELEQLPSSTLTPSTTAAANSSAASTNTSAATSATTTSKLPLFVPPSSTANSTDIEEETSLQNGTDSDEEVDLSANSTLLEDAGPENSTVLENAVSENSTLVENAGSENSTLLEDAVPQNSTLLEDAVPQDTTEAGKNVSNTSAESSTTQKKKKASPWSLLSNSKEVANSRSIELAVGEAVSQRSSRHLPGTKPMCYVLTIKYDGFEMTNRGCGAALPDRNLTCKMLSKGQPYAECGLCDGNKCNSASRLKIALVHFSFALVLLALRSW